MIDTSKIDYSELDRPEILSFLFYPRPEWGTPPESPGQTHLMIPVDDGNQVGAALHIANQTAPTMLFFHGNGEIVADYDDMGAMYAGMGINFLPVDYRGYGRSTGAPSITAMMRDCHYILDYIEQWLADEGYTGALVAMGRSMGSASALELAAHYPDQLSGLIIESGFASMGGLYERVGISDSIPEGKLKGLSNVDKIAKYEEPTLVIHAEFDQIIPFSAGRELYEAAAAPDKTLLRIPGADHNDIFYRGREAYLDAILTLVDKARQT